MALSNKCPTCGSGSNRSDIGRDGSPRVMDATPFPVLQDPVSVKRRTRARRIVAQNNKGKK